MTDAQRASVKAEYAAAGIKIIVSLFGSTDAPTSSGADPIATANKMAAWVKEFELDGVDVDYEAICGFNNSLKMNTHLIVGFQCDKRQRWKGRGKCCRWCFT